MSDRNSTPSPKVTRPIFRYHGGKWRIAPWIIHQLPPHRTYVEPFCGAGSVLLRKHPSHTEVLNDKHHRLVNAFRVLRDPVQSRRLKAQLLLTPYSESEYQAAREPSKDPIEDARRLIVLGHQAHGSTGVSGKKSGWRRGVRPRGPNSATEWHILPDQVYAWAQRLRSVYIEQKDFADVIERWDSPQTVFYVDPPYLAQTRTAAQDAYLHEMSEVDHIRLAAQLKHVKGMVLLSGYHSELYSTLYADWQTVTKSAMADQNQRRQEVLWLSPNIPDVNLPSFSDASMPLRQTR